MKNKQKLFFIDPCNLDKDLLLKWANQQFLEGLKINTEKIISKKEHHNWLNKILNKKNCFFKIIKYENEKIGQNRQKKKKNFL